MLKSRHRNQRAIVLYDSISNLRIKCAKAEDGAMSDQNEMCWLPSPIAGEGLILYLKPAGRMWRPYNTYREFAVPDYPIPGGSKGWATYQKLTRSHGVLLPTPRDTEGNAVMPGSVPNG